MKDPGESRTSEPDPLAHRSRGAGPVRRADRGGRWARRGSAPAAASAGAAWALGLTLAVAIAACGPHEPPALVAANTWSPAAAGAAQHEVVVRHAGQSGRLGLEVAARGPSGDWARVPCATCHTLLAPPSPAQRVAGVSEFHTGLRLRHGELTCGSCHGAPDYAALRLADGRDVQPADVMTLCGQCHGSQRRDWEHGAHGGMRGHWDLTRGPRERQTCTACHDPHAPAFVGMNPAPGPRDRFQGPRTEEHHD